jgi:transcriptional regulator with XRE-family HTH domain
MTFSDLLKQYRALRGVSVAELAESSGVQARTIRRLEAGQDGMKAAVAVSLCVALSIDEVAAMRWLRPDLS